MTSDQRVREAAQQLVDTLAPFMDDRRSHFLSRSHDPLFEPFDDLRQALAHGVEVREPPTIPRKAALEFAAEFRRRAGRNDISQVAPALACDLALLLEREAARHTPLSGEPNAPETGQDRKHEYGSDIACWCGEENEHHPLRTTTLSPPPASSARQPSALKPCPFCGEEPLVHGRYSSGWWDKGVGPVPVECDTEFCPLRGKVIASDLWNRRAVPDAQDARALLERLVNDCTRLLDNAEGYDKSNVRAAFLAWYSDGEARSDKVMPDLLSAEEAARHSWKAARDFLLRRAPGEP